MTAPQHGGGGVLYSSAPLLGIMCHSLRSGGLPLSRPCTARHHDSSAWFHLVAVHSHALRSCTLLCCGCLCHTVAAAQTNALEFALDVIASGEYEAGPSPAPLCSPPEVNGAEPSDKSSESGGPAKDMTTWRRRMQQLLSPGAGRGCCPAPSRPAQARPNGFVRELWVLSQRSWKIILRTKELFLARLLVFVSAHARCLQ